MIEGIIEFTYRPVLNKKPAVTMLFGFLAVSALLVVASVISPYYKGVISLFAVFGLCASVLVYTKYIVCEYAYVVAYDNGDNPVFIITRRTGKSVTTLCHILLSEITDIEKETREQRRKHVTPNGMKKYNFAPNLFPADTYRIKAKSRYNSAEFVIEGNDEMAARLLEYSALARQHEDEIEE